MINRIAWYDETSSHYEIRYWQLINTIKSALFWGNDTLCTIEIEIREKLMFDIMDKSPQSSKF